MIWTYVPGPGGSCFGALCDDEAEFDRVIGHDEVVLDGQVGVVAEHDRASLRVRFDLREPWRPPPIRITFEDHDQAERIAALGLHVFEGGLHTATLIAPGVITLDRVYTDNPPGQWHGHEWPSENEAKVPA